MQALHPCLRVPRVLSRGAFISVASLVVDSLILACSYNNNINLAYTQSENECC